MPTKKSIKEKRRKNYAMYLVCISILEPRIPAVQAAHLSMYIVHSSLKTKQEGVGQIHLTYYWFNVVTS